jgi:hypothetical protein
LLLIALSWLPISIESRAIAASAVWRLCGVITLPLTGVLVGFTHPLDVLLIARVREAIGAGAIRSWFVHLVVPFH